jgi:hypothetical protein
MSFDLRVPKKVNMRYMARVIVVATSFMTVGGCSQSRGQPSATPGQPTTQQQPELQTGQQSSPRGPQSFNAVPTTVTISGCIRNAPPATPSAASGSSPAAIRFELLNPRIATDATVSPTGQPRTTTRYELEGDDHLIGRHVDQYVEIAGMVTASDTAADPILKVGTVTMITVECESS